MRRHRQRFPPSQQREREILMSRSVFIRVVCVTALVLAVVACSSGPASIGEFKLGKTEDAAQTIAAFDTRDTLYGVATINNPPEGGKVVGRLIIAEVEGQQAGPIPGLETTLPLTAGMNTAKFDFSPPTAGWPNGKYQMEVVLLDGSGAEKDKKTADFTAAGNEPAPAAADSTETETDTATTETPAQQ
jgi:hypothetical protein